MTDEYIENYHEMHPDFIKPDDFDEDAYDSSIGNRIK